ncbi:phosphatase [Moraxella caviae]|uniref:Phosphatase n=1 Tax=Moraxella caviae TaxID=34060 RepID=A0A1T0A6D1_9GAMM|nr:PHP domain-containing protein [Moraxella caviae]OOR91333.1 phosphatase [Moraxella caviae]STZ13943.1 Histidinol phosphatase and related hydrolases of the PHP family [Moraxella caviae]VEW11121.1 Histidinol phosphatase and related hydrolases of the PHP family [Moraxella caviae]
MTKNLRIDLHSHSTSSDGTFSPSELVQLAHSVGIDVLALTDHDTVSGVQEASMAAKSLGMTLISGVEISCRHALSGGYGKHQSIDKIIHVVALDMTDLPRMDKALQALQDSREQRGWQMVQKLGEILAQDEKLTAQVLDAPCFDEADKSSAASQIRDVLWRAVLQKAGSNAKAVGRAHIGQVLKDVGVVANVQAAFDKYLADGKPAYVAIDAISMADAVRLIHECGGVAVLAHPTRYGLSATRTRRLIADFAMMGGDGCELPNQEPDSLRAMIDRSIAEHGLKVSVGSDFHGTNMPWRKLGATAKPKAEQVPIWQTWDL